MSEILKELRHYSARLDIWWARRKRQQIEADRQRHEKVATARQVNAEHQRALAAGEVALPQGWHQYPKDPPGYVRWWDGERWTEHTQQSALAKRNTGRKESGGLAMAGGISFLVGLFFWPLFLATFVIGIVLATRPGRGGDGALLIVLSVLGPILSLIGCAAVLTSGS